MWNRVSPSRLRDIEAQRICIIKPSALGDVVQTVPVVHALRRRFPDARLSWVINVELADLLEDHPDVDELILFDRYASVSGWWRLLTDLRQREFDLVFDLQGLARTGLMTAATRASLRVGLQTAREGSHLTYHCRLPNTGRKRPAHERYWQVAEAVGVGDTPRTTKLTVKPADDAVVQSVLRPAGERILAVHPGARWMSKRWPIEKFAVVACKAMRLYGFATVIVGSSAEADSGLQLQELLHKFVPAGTVINLTGATTLRQAAAVLRASDLLLTNDSGPMHLAAGLGVPVLGVFTCTSPIRSGPPGDQHALVSTNVPCAARYKKRCPKRGRKHLACMEELSTQRVCDALTRLMQQGGFAPRDYGTSRAA